MTELSKILPPDLESWVQAQAASGEYFDGGDFLRDLVRKARSEMLEIAWIREQVADGIASGFIERDAREVLKEIVAERRARRG
jgi:Arc/MetJ-type ribon-helix-helix transcriptional regulator